MTGRILQGIGGFYTVRCDGQDYVCKLRGKFRRQRITPTVGDIVDFIPGKPGDEGSVEGIHERKNILVRPPVANLDVILVTMAASSPEPDLLLVDRLLVNAAAAGIPAWIVINKAELADTQNIARQYMLSGYKTFVVSAQTGEGMDGLKDAVRGMTVGFAGQSAVGKSSLINALYPGLDLEVGDLSKIQRGRHTTRRAQLLPLENGGYLVDTPGFSLMELEGRDPATLKDLYQEFAPYAGKCYYLTCTHITEPGCAVKQAVEEGTLSEQRLERYAKLFDELKEKWNSRYN